MANNEDFDIAWEQAVSWIMRQHESQLDEVDLKIMKTWLQEDPLHQKVYGKARALWVATGLIPSVDEQ